MKLYFQADYESNLSEFAVKIEGQKAGFAGYSPTFAEVEEDCIIEFLPVNAESLCPLSFAPSDKLLKNPPPTLKSVDLGGVYLLSPKFPAIIEKDSKILAQEREGDLLATLYKDGSDKISLEKNGLFFMENVCPLNSPKISFHTLSQNQFVCLSGFKGADSYLIIYHVFDAITKVFENKVQYFDFSELLTTVIKFRDMASHSASVEWEFSQGGFKRRSYKITKSENFDYFALNDKLKPYAFFEEVFCHGEFADFLDDNLRYAAEKIYSYLGDFCAVIPPPHFRNQCDVGLVYKKSENIFYVKWFEVTLSEGLVTNIVQK